MARAIPTDGRQLRCWEISCPRDVRDDIAHDGQRMFVILGQMIDHARFARVQIAAAQILGADFFARRGLHQRRAGEEDRALIADDHALVGHGGHIGPARRAAAHHAGNLRDLLGAHVRLIEEDAPEMVAVGEDLILMRQVRAAAVDQIDARQAVCLGNFLRAQMLLDGHRVVGAALHRRIVADDHALPARNAANAGDQPRAGDFAVVQVVRRKLADFEKGRAGIEQPLHPLARQQLAARRMPLARLLIPAKRGFGNLGPECVLQRAVMRGVGARLFIVGVEGVVRTGAVKTKASPFASSRLRVRSEKLGSREDAKTQRYPSCPDQLPPDQHPPYLIRPRADIHQLAVAQISLHRPILGIARPAQRLHRFERDLHAILAGEQHRARRVEARRLPGIARLAHRIDIGARRIERDIHVRHLGLHQLEAPTGHAKLLALADIGDDGIKASLHDAKADPRQHRAFIIKAGHQHADAAVERPHHILIGNEAIIEHEFGGRADRASPSCRSSGQC